MTQRSRTGLTLVELLVVIAVVGILAGLLFPAILRSRTAGRKTQCAGNLKQLAQAVQSFHNRTDRLPPYWGSMNGGGGEAFGGWLLHILPDLDQQAAYDRVPIRGTLAVAPSTTVSSTIWVDQTETRPTGRMLPGRPPSPNYQPAQMATGTAYDANNNSYIYPVVIPQVGDPGEPPQPEYTTVVIGPPKPVVQTVTSGFANWGGLSDQYDTETSRLALPVLLDPEDTGPTRSPTNPTGVSSGYENAPLTNYQINAHALVRFGGPPFWGGNSARMILNEAGTALTYGVGGPPVRGFNVTPIDPAYREFAGYFAPPAQQTPGAQIRCHHGQFWAEWDHTQSGQSGPDGGRRWDHVVDGLSNTLLFAEGMRQCDAGKVYRHAFLPSGPGGRTDQLPWLNIAPMAPPGCGWPSACAYLDVVTSNWFHEHAFGILPSLRQVITYAGSSVISGTTRAAIPSFGHTLMFQTQPLPVDCNPTRMQALHGNFLMTAMCDGSVRAISSLVSRREPVGAAASGRDRFGTNLGNFQSRGGGERRKDGVWDMLMVPRDPPDNVLSNTGEVGRERGPNDDPL
jgi:prepilin-type N-terminal cleavage/methylation domain-containing protein